MMWTNVVVLSEPQVDDRLCLVDRSEPFRVQHLTAQCSIEAFIVSIFPRRAWVDLDGSRRFVNKYKLKSQWGDRVLSHWLCYAVRRTDEFEESEYSDRLVQYTLQITVCQLIDGCKAFPIASVDKCIRELDKKTAGNLSGSPAGLPNLTAILGRVTLSSANVLQCGIQYGSTSRELQSVSDDLP